MNLTTHKYKLIVGSIIASIIGLEGIYSNNPNDPGGETKYGITLQTARDYGYTGSMQDLPYELAQAIYEKKYILEPKYKEVIQLSPAVGHKLIDAGVNVGHKRSSLWFQKALNSLSNNGTQYPKVSEDGIIGTKTIQAYSSLAQKRGANKACKLVIKLVDAQQAVHYMSLKNLSDFTVGWVDNRIQNIPLSQCDDYHIENP